MRKQSKSRKHPGFTIIEVVLVLAIAGLVFLMVFIALPAMQRGQRNAQRKNDISLIAAAMSNWRKHNFASVSDNYSLAHDKSRGFCTFYKRYVGDEVADPTTGEAYKASLWQDQHVINCITGETIDRGKYDDSAIGRRPNSHWASMEVGDIQYDDVAVCDGEVFNDDLGRSAGLHAFAFRILLEGGATLCVDNGVSDKKVAVDDNNFIQGAIDSFALAVSSLRFFIEH